MLTLRTGSACGQHPRHQRVTGLVIGGHDPLAVGDDPALALRSRDDAVDRFRQLIPADRLAVLARGQDRRFVDQVLQIGAGESRRLPRQALDRDVLLERLAPDMDLQDRHPALDIGPVENHLAVEAPGPQQRRVEHVRPVRRRDDDHVRRGVEPVHLDQDLVERLLPLVVAAAQSGSALTADRVDLVDEDDARCIALRLVEEIAHAAGADADEHLHELRSGDAEEGHPGLAGDRPREQRLSGTRRSDQQDAARNARAQGRELLRVLEELDDFDQLLLGLFDAGDVREDDRRPVRREEPGAALAERHRLVVRALRLAHEEDEDADQQERRQDEGQRSQPGAPAAGWLELEQSRRQVRGIDAVVLEHGEEVGLGRDGRHRVAETGLLLVLDLDLAAALRLDQLLHLAVTHLLRDLADAAHRWRAVVADERRPHGQNRDDEHDPDQTSTYPTLLRH